MAQVDPVALKISGKAKLVGVLGYPVEHSLSPPMQNAAVAAAGIDAVYIPMAVAPDDLGTVVNGLRAAGFVGVNVTIPHKVNALRLVDELSASAEMVGAVNTLHFVEDKVLGYNTDGTGFLQSLAVAGVEPAGLTVTVLGAGGAARSIALHLAMAGVERINLINRTYDKAGELAAVVNSHLGTNPHSVARPHPWDERSLRECLSHSQLLVNTTPVGMSSHSPGQSPVQTQWLHQELVVYDTVYNPLRTELIQQAEQAGCLALSGSEMLVMQGAESFRIWFGQEPNVDEMRRALLRALRNTR